MTRLVLTQPLACFSWPHADLSLPRKLTCLQVGENGSLELCALGQNVEDPREAVEGQDLSG